MSNYYCCTDPACSHALFLAAKMETIRLSSTEREIILQVLQRDEELRKAEKERVMQLKVDLQNLRRKGAIKASIDWASIAPDPNKSCCRCRTKLGCVINRGAYCRSCRLKVCTNCREYYLHTTDWVCIVCFKRMEIQAVSGEWMNEFVRRPSRRRDNRLYVPTADIIKYTIRRSKTISNLTSRWNTSNSCPLIRTYYSLPREHPGDYPYLTIYDTVFANSKKLACVKNLPTCSPHLENVSTGRKTTLWHESAINASVKPFLRSSNMHPITPSVSTTNYTSSMDRATSLTSQTEDEIIATDLKSPPFRINPLTKAAAEGKIAKAVPFEVQGGKEYNQLFNHVKNNSFKNSGCNSSQKENGETFVLKNDVNDRKGDEKRVSFNDIKNNVDCYNFVRTNLKNNERSILKPISKSLDCTATSDHKITLYSTNSLPEENSNLTSQPNKNVATSVEFPNSRVCSVNELCEIEPRGGTIFRKVTVRKRRQDMKKSIAIDNARAGVRSDELLSARGNVDDTVGERAGASVASLVVNSEVHHVPYYISVVMITQEPVTSFPQVSVVTSDTTTLVPDNDIGVRRSNWQILDNNENLECNQHTSENSSMRISRIQERIVNLRPEHNRDVMVITHSNSPICLDSQNEQYVENITVVTGGDSLSAVVCLEDGLADDDSWVENLSNDGEDLVVTTSTEDSSSEDEITLRCTASVDHEDELRGYHRAAIDFTLHTIVEESCEESEVEQLSIANMVKSTSATNLEKYFFFDLGEGNITSVNLNRDNAQSETSSICSEGLDCSGIAEEALLHDGTDDGELASSRLEKYFLSDFMGFIAERRDSDGSVGSDSEGHPSPEQRRKRLVRARGTGRSHSSSLDNLLINNELLGDSYSGDNQINSEDISSSDSDINEEGNSFDKFEGSVDTVKRKKNKKLKSILSCSTSTEELKVQMEEHDMQKINEENIRIEDGNISKTDTAGTVLLDCPNNRYYQGRDSGFIGSCDDLIKEQKELSELLLSTKNNLKLELEKIAEEKKYEEIPTTPSTNPSIISLNRKDSFNNWSSDEETNLMMCKMRQFFKTMVANSNNTQTLTSSKSVIPVIGNDNISSNIVPSPRFKNRYKPPQLVYFENELTRLMKTVPGIKDEEVREIVEYLSSEDTWSDSYDSSDYTSSDLDCATSCNKSILRQQISDSCQEIISKFENVDRTCENNLNLNKESSFVYEKLVASFEKITTDLPDSTAINAPYSSPPLIAKVMHHIGSRLVALMHEVSNSESHDSNSPKIKYYHRRFHQKLSNASSTTTEDDDSAFDNIADKSNNLHDVITPFSILPRSKSHDLLLSESRTLTQSSSGVSDIVEEREASDYERFSWRGSFESTLMATDSRNKLSLLGSEGSASASALAVASKRRSAGDLMFNHMSLSREQLDRVRSCGSIGGGNSEDKSWIAPAIRPRLRRSSVPDATSGSADSADCDEDEDLENRATLPRSLQTSTANTNSLPRLPTTASTSTMFKSHSMHHFLQHNVKSARYRPPGFNKSSTASPKRASSAPGLQISHQRRGRKSQQSNLITTDDVIVSEQIQLPISLPKGISKSASPSPVAHGKRRNTTTVSSQEWPNHDEDIDRYVAIQHNRSSLSALGLRSDSLASVYSGAGEGRYGTVAVRGQVEFGLQYNYKASALEVLIKQCKDLAAVDLKRNRSDPYVKVYLLPDKSKSGKRKTKVKKHSLNPIFDELLRFHISLNGLETRTLWLTVWHSDMFGRNDFLGEVMIALENKVFDDPTPKWYNLQERTEPFEDVQSFKGDILVCLKYIPPDMTVYKKGKRSRGTLHIKVKEARCLTAVKTNGTSDPFCKSYLLPDKGRSSKQKTAVMRKTVNAMWNHTFVYEDVTLQELAERCLELTVWDHDRLGSNEFLGGVRFSMGTGKHYGKSVDWMDSTGKELALWKSMFERPSFWVEGCLPLRPTLDNRTA